MPFIPESQPIAPSKSGPSTRFVPEATPTIQPIQRSPFTYDTSDSGTTGKILKGTVNQVNQFGVGLGTGIAKAGIGMGQSFLKISQALSSKVLGTDPNVYNNVIKAGDEIKEKVFTKPYQNELETFTGKAGDITGQSTPFIATTPAIKSAQSFTAGLTEGTPYLIRLLGKVAPESIISGATEYARSGGDKESAKTAAYISGALSLVSHAASDAYRNLIPQDVKQNVVKSLGSMKGKQSLSGVASGKRANDAVDAYTTIARNAPDIDVVDVNGITKKFDPKTADFIEMPQALYQTKNKIYEAYTQLAKNAGDSGASFKAKDFYKVIDDLKKYEGAGYTDAYSSKANKIIEALQRYVKVGEKGQKFFGDTDLREIQKLVENINVDVNPLTDKAGAQVAGEASRAIREILDDKISSATGEQYQALRTAYSQLKAIEPDVIANFKKATAGSKLSDVISGAAYVDMLQGVITRSPEDLVRGGLIAGVKKIINYVRDPEVAMRRAFEIIMDGPSSAGRFTGGAVPADPAMYAAGAQAKQAVKGFMEKPALGLSVQPVSNPLEYASRHFSSSKQILDNLPEEDLKSLGGIRGLLERTKTNIVDGLKEVNPEAAPLIERIDIRQFKDLKSFESAVKAAFPQGRNSLGQFAPKTIHPDDLAELSDFTDYVAGSYKPKTTQIVTDARRIAVKYGLLTAEKAKNIGDKALSSLITKSGIFK